MPNPPIPRLLAATAAGTAALALVVVTGSATAAADTTGPDATPDAADLDLPGAVATAMARDLSLTSDQVTDIAGALAGVADQLAAIRTELGSSYGGAWFDHETASLVVTTTDPGASAMVRAAGARAELVPYSEAELAAVQQELDELAQVDPEQLAGVYSWRVDPVANRVVVTVAAGSIASTAVTDPYGDRVQVETAVTQPELQDHDGAWFDGGSWHEWPGTGWPMCSTAFNVHHPTNGNRYFLTAGHCAEVGQETDHGGIALGAYVASTFPEQDEALVQITNSFWQHGPRVWQWPDAITIQGAQSSPVGAPICHSGLTTQVTCGLITAKNETVVYVGGDTVFGMGRYNACTEAGDSGGAVYSPGFFAEGIHSGGSTIEGECLEKHGLENIAFYQEVIPTLSRYEIQFEGVVITTG